MKRWTFWELSLFTQRIFWSAEARGSLTYCTSSLAAAIPGLNLSHNAEIYLNKYMLINTSNDIVIMRIYIRVHSSRTLTEHGSSRTARLYIIILEHWYVMVILETYSTLLGLNHYYHSWPAVVILEPWLTLVVQHLSVVIILEPLSTVVVLEHFSL